MSPFLVLGESVGIWDLINVLRSSELTKTSRFLPPDHPSRFRYRIPPASHHRRSTSPSMLPRRLDWKVPPRRREGLQIPQLHKQQNPALTPRRNPSQPEALYSSTMVRRQQSPRRNHRSRLRRNALLHLPMDRHSRDPRAKDRRDDQ